MKNSSAIVLGVVALAGGLVLLSKKSPAVSAGTGFGASGSPFGIVPANAPLSATRFWRRRRYGNWPRTTATATVSSTAGVNVRTAPNMNAQSLGVMAKGSQVEVNQTGLTASDGSPGEWWRITTIFGNAQPVTGYARAVDAAGYHNLLTV
jgi:hypothetical protein